jgi:hypothetical protein
LRTADVQVEQQPSFLFWGGDVLSQRGALVVSNRVLRAGQHSCPNKLGSSFQVS